MDPAASEALFEEAVQHMKTMACFERGSWPIVSASYPTLVVELPHPTGYRRFFRFGCENWDETAPSVTSVDADGKVLPGEPRGSLWMGLKTGWGLCVPGTREYHDHHPENPWENHRAGRSLASIVMSVACHYRNGEP